jgi:hypothetical protein
MGMVSSARARPHGAISGLRSWKDDGYFFEGKMRHCEPTRIHIFADCAVCTASHQGPHLPLVRATEAKAMNAKASLQIPTFGNWGEQAPAPHASASATANTQKPLSNIAACMKI